MQAEILKKLIMSSIRILSCVLVGGSEPLVSAMGVRYFDQGNNCHQPLIYVILYHMSQGTEKGNVADWSRNDS